VKVNRGNCAFFIQKSFHNDPGIQRCLALPFFTGASFIHPLLLKNLKLNYAAGVRNNVEKKLSNPLIYSK
jgi:hypothetical protein